MEKLIERLIYLLLFKFFYELFRPLKNEILALFGESENEPENQK